jgi:hypothetical protein
MLGVNLNKLVFLIATALLLTSCAKDESAHGPQVEEPIGSREFKIQSTKSAFKVSLVGVHMGTPDYEAVWSVIEAANAQGKIDTIVQYATPIEGGVAHCIEVLNSSVRTQILEDLKNAPTSLEESHYSIESVDDCSQ